ncbi:hypothetical protein Jab_1c23320 [Janthinobacterium sp. HH01]|uniref:hypothetical protein n=1 Tax=Janthinobacterium sp. HH01 TaxID=1198452 RepID=UPI0002AEC4FF|nr:hypothetical protein [Janthinobacterium sp. HH01]ELX13694.1 hypothetical protein Jab_1c23320 [Janthinobacterium sp. HH01]
MSRPRIALFPEDQPILKPLNTALHDILRVYPGLNIPETMLRRTPEAFADAVGYRHPNDLRASMRTVPQLYHRFDSLDDICIAFADGLRGAIPKVFSIEIDQGTSAALALKMKPSLAQLTIARKIMSSPVDKLLIAARAPAYEFSILLDHHRPYAFEFGRAREAYSQLMEGWDAGLTEDGRTQALFDKVVRPTWRPLAESVRDGRHPSDHTPILVADRDKNLVGVTLIHQTHQGVIPALCLRQEDLTIMQERLLSTGQAHLNLSSDSAGWSMSHLSSDRDGNLWGEEAFYLPTTFDAAYATLNQIEKARDGDRVSGPNGNWQPLLNARFVIQTVWHGGGPGRYQTLEFALVTSTRGPAPSKMMNEGGRISVTEEQFYIRQNTWLDEMDLRDLFPSGRLTDLPKDVTWEAAYTKIVPDYVRDFQTRAELMVEGMARDGVAGEMFTSSLAKIRAQGALIKRIDDYDDDKAMRRKSAGIRKLLVAEQPISVA